MIIVTWISQASSPLSGHIWSRKTEETCRVILSFTRNKSQSKLCSYVLAAAAKSLQSCLTLCNPTDGSPPGSPIPGILQARTLEWVAISFPNAWKWKVKVKSLSHVQPTLRDPMDCSLPGSSVHGIFQARVLEWGAIAFSVTCTHTHTNTDTHTHLYLSVVHSNYIKDFQISLEENYCF